MPDDKADAAKTDPSPSVGPVWVVAALAAMPALVSAVVSVGVDFTPASDYAPIEVRVRDALSAHPPLVGAYSRVDRVHLVRLAESLSPSCGRLPRPPECTDVDELMVKDRTVTILPPAGMSPPPVAPRDESHA